MTATHHGQFKTPGGKLIAIDFSVVDNQLQDVKVHGDFFLEPDNAFESIRKSLEGASIEESDKALAKRVAQSIPEGTEWLGASPEALVAAMRRGLGAVQESGGGDRGWS